MIKKLSHREEGGQAWLVPGERKILPRPPFFPLVPSGRASCWVLSLALTSAGTLHSTKSLHSQIPADKSEKARRKQTSRSRHPHRAPPQLQHLHSNPGPGLQSFPFYTTLLLAQSPGLPACSPAEGAASPTLHGDSPGAQGKHSPGCRASSSPPPHLLTETRLLLFLTLQLPLAWGSPLYPHPLAPTRWHHSVILRALLQPEGPGGRSGCPGRAGLWGKQNKSVTAQVSEFPHPDSFRTRASQPALLLSAIPKAAEGERDFWAESYRREGEWAPRIQLRRLQFPG